MVSTSIIKHWQGPEGASPRKNTLCRVGQSVLRQVIQADTKVAGDAGDNWLHSYSKRSQWMSVKTFEPFGNHLIVQVGWIFCILIYIHMVSTKS